MRTVFGFVCLGMLALSGCYGKVAEGTPSQPHGRYAGIGIRSADRMWAAMKAADSTNDANAAKRTDDDAVIVVVDSVTGEVRQCGDMSGYCVRMNPWSQSAAPAPVALAKHATEMAADTIATVDNTAAVDANAQ